MEVKNGGKKMRNHKKAFSKKMLSVLLSIIVLTTLLYAGLVNANANEVAMPIASATGTVSLNSNEVNARNLSFDEMINEISSRTGKERQQIVTEMIELKRGENVNKFTVEKVPPQIM